MKRIGFMTGFALATLLLTACADKKTPERTEKVIPVKVITVVPATTTTERNYIGTVEESTAIALSFSMPGTVEEVFVAEGQKVVKGQLLATLNSATAQNTLDAATAQLNRAQDAYDRMATLHDNGSLPDIKFVEVESGLQQAKSQAAIARKNLDDCKLYAPRSGVIAARSVEPGANVMPDMTAFKLVTIAQVLVKIPVPENEIGDIREGQPATLNVPALDGETFAGKVERKGVTANAVSHAYEVKIGIANPQLRLMPGMVCKVFLMQDGQKPAVIVPNRAIQTTHDGRRFVWLAGSDRAQRRFVETGNLSNSGVKVESGLSENEQVIVEGYQKVSEGTKISISNR
jgi:RND family efflux transporter MFP subunit